MLQLNDENLKKQKELQQMHNKKRVRARKDSVGPKEEEGVCLSARICVCVRVR